MEFFRIFVWLNKVNVFIWVDKFVYLNQQGYIINIIECFSQKTTVSIISFQINSLKKLYSRIIILHAILITFYFDK